MKFVAGFVLYVVIGFVMVTIIQSGIDASSGKDVFQVRTFPNGRSPDPESEG